MKRIKFFLFAYWYDPRWHRFVGATVKIRDLAFNLSRQGYDVTLLVPRYNFSLKEKNLKVIEVPFWDMPILRPISFKAGLLFYILAYSFLKMPDIVYVRRMNSIIPGIYAILTKAKFFYEINDDPFSKQINEGTYLGKKIKKSVSLIIEKINLTLCNRGFVITPEIIDKIRRKIPGIKIDKFIHLPSGANTQLFQPMEKQKCRSEIKLDSNSYFIGFVGTLLQHQGVEILIEAAKWILPKMPNTRFFIIGEGPLKTRYIEKAEVQGVTDYFIFTGQIEYEKMPIWINAMDVCVAPFLQSAGSRSPVKIFDYMACGKPVVASKIEGTTDIFEKSGAITFVKPADPQSLSVAICALLEDAMLRKKHGELARQYIL